MRVTINKYGQTIALPPKDNTSLERAVEAVLNEAKVTYIKQFAFDETGLRAKKFDFAIIKNDRIVFLIECDGAPHYKESYYVSCGNRECRAKAHLVKRHLGDAEKDSIAVKHGIPLLRVNDMHKDIARDLIISWIWQFCDEADEKAKEISMVKMLDKYGWDFDYVRPSATTKAEELFLNERG